MKTASIMASSVAGQTLLGFLAEQCPEAEKALRSGLKMFACQRGLFGDSAIMVFDTQGEAEEFEKTHLSKFEKALIKGFKEQVHVTLNMVEVAY
jgi:hypothetical protein